MINYSAAFIEYLASKTQAYDTNIACFTINCQQKENVQL